MKHGEPGLPYKPFLVAAFSLVLLTFNLIVKETAFTAKWPVTATLHYSPHFFGNIHETIFNLNLSCPGSNSPLHAPFVYAYKSPCHFYTLCKWKPLFDYRDHTTEVLVLQGLCSCYCGFSLKRMSIWWHQHQWHQWRSDAWPSKNTVFFFCNEILLFWSSPINGFHECYVLSLGFQYRVYNVSESLFCGIIFALL